MGLKRNKSAKHQQRAIDYLGYSILTFMLTTLSMINKQIEIAFIFSIITLTMIFISQNQSNKIK